VGGPKVRCGFEFEEQSTIFKRQRISASAKMTETCSELTPVWAKGEAALSVRD
jgi:hypothetical protein